MMKNCDDDDENHEYDGDDKDNHTCIVGDGVAYHELITLVMT